jgi:hypothetical protein
MRLPYIPDPPNFTSEADKAVEQRVRARRGEKGLIALDRTLLHAPPIADGWWVHLSQSFYASRFLMSLRYGHDSASEARADRISNNITFLLCYKPY